MHKIERISEMGEGHGICLLSSSHSFHVARIAADNLGNLRAIVKMSCRVIARTADSAAGGELAGILWLCWDGKKPAGLGPGGLLQVSLVAGTGFEPVTFRL